MQEGKQSLWTNKQSDHAGHDPFDKYVAETYMNKGLTRQEALAYIECLKTQDLLSNKMGQSINQNKNGGQH